MSNESKIAAVVLSTTETDILERVDNACHRLHSEFFKGYNEDSLKNIVAYCKHESLIDNIRFGEGFELPKQRYDQIFDSRVDKEKLYPHIEIFNKRVIKVDPKTHRQFEEDVPTVRILEGYGTQKPIDIESFFRDSYMGDDKETIVDLLKAVRETRKAARDAEKAWMDNTVKTRDKKLSDEFKKASLLHKEAKAAKSEYFSRFPYLDELVSQISDEVHTVAVDFHVAKQSQLKNRIAVIQTALREEKRTKAAERIDMKRERSASIKALMHKLIPESNLKTTEYMTEDK
jgi:uncharacterized protein YifE (UPF0438 family)